MGCLAGLDEIAEQRFDQPTSASTTAPMAIDHGAPQVRLALRCSSPGSPNAVSSSGCRYPGQRAGGLITFVAAIYTGGALVVSWSSPTW